MRSWYLGRPTVWHAASTPKGIFKASIAGSLRPASSIIPRSNVSISHIDRTGEHSGVSSSLTKCRSLTASYRTSIHKNRYIYGVLHRWTCSRRRIYSRYSRNRLFAKWVIRRSLVGHCYKWQPRASMHPADGLHACNTQSNPKYMISKQSAGTQAHLSRFDNSQRPDTSESLLVKVGERSFHCSNHSDGLNLWAFTDA